MVNFDMDFRMRKRDQIAGLILFTIFIVPLFVAAYMVSIYMGVAMTATFIFGIVARTTA